jgi:hypothetical protein
MKKLFVLLFFVVGLNCFSESFNFAGHKWYQLMGTSFYTTCKSLDELRNLGKIFGFDIDKPSDVIYNLKNEVLETKWGDYQEQFYSKQVSDKYLVQGVYLVEILCDPELTAFKNNKMSSWIQIWKVRDNSFTRSYKNSKMVGLGLQVY